jgi:hypothetical protein
MAHSTPDGDNQTGGAAAGTLTAEFQVDGNTTFYSHGASKVNATNQHFFVVTDGDAVLVDAGH